MTTLLTSGKPGLPHVWHLPELTSEERAKRLGIGSVEMKPVLTAGERTTVTFQFEIGETELPVGGRLRVVWRWPIDWQDLQTDDPGGDGYMTVSADAVDETVVLEADYDRARELDPWMHCIELTVRQGRLTQSDRVRLVCGDRSGGGSGWRAPTCRVNATEFLMLLDPDASDRWLRLSDPPRYKIEAGAPARLVAVTTADAKTDEPFDVWVYAEDAWGNATRFDAPLQLTLVETETDLSRGTLTVKKTAVSEEPAAHRVTASIDQAGHYRVSVSAPSLGIQAVSNPIRVFFTQTPAYRQFWGDLHSGQSEIGCGAGTLAEHYAYARDVSGLQFVTHQANDHYVTTDIWQHTREQTDLFQEDGEFVVFLGCEWSPPTVDGGDRNVVYRHDELRMRRSGRFYTALDPDPEPDIPTAPEFHAAFADEEILVNMHVGGRPTNLDYHAPHLEPLAEIHSTHATSEWFVEDALKRGYRVGITAGADGVTGRPGADHPAWRLNRNVRSGLTSVYADALTKDALWEAFQARRCYGTTGERIRLWTEVDGHPMGEAYATEGHPLIKIEVEGTAAIERVDLLRGTEVLCSWNIALPSDELLRVLWSGSRSLGTARAQQLVWDGSLAASAGRISKVSAVGFQSPEDDVRIDDEQNVIWCSVTAGNSAGFIFRWEAEDDADEAPRCHFVSEPCSFDFDLRQVSLAPMVVDAGLIKAQVAVGPAPREGGATRVELSYRDTAPLSGETPYWVRVVQVDQAKAWSSPVYVSRK